MALLYLCWIAWHTQHIYHKISDQRSKLSPFIFQTFGFKNCSAYTAYVPKSNMHNDWNFTFYFDKLSYSFAAHVHSKFTIFRENQTFFITYSQVTGRTCYLEKGFNDSTESHAIKIKPRKSFTNKTIRESFRNCILYVCLTFLEA